MKHVIGGRDGLLQGCGFLVTQAMSQLIKGYRGKSALGQASHQWKKLIGTATPAMHEYDCWTFAGSVGLDVAIPGFDDALVYSPW